MKGNISLAEELRAIRGGGNNRAWFKRAPESQNSEAPWHADIERMEQSLQELLRVISQFSGVKLPEGFPASEGEGDSLPRVDINTLKDKIRSELQAFSVNTAEDLARQAEEQTRAALGALQQEMSGQVDQVAIQLREKLPGGLGEAELGIDIAQQSRDRVAELVREKTDEFAQWVWLTCKGTGAPIPSQVEKLLEPYVEEATARLADTFQKDVQGLLAEQEQLAGEKREAARQTLQSELDSLEQASLHRCEENANLVATQSADHLNAAADEAVRGFQGRLESEVEGAFGRFHARLAELSEAAETEFQRDRNQQVEDFRQRLASAAGEAQEKRLSKISSSMTQMAADVVESSIQHLHHQMEDTLQHSREEINAFMRFHTEKSKQEIQGAGEQARESLLREAQQAEGTISGLKVEIAGMCEQHVADSRQQLDSIARECMSPMQERIRQAAESQMEEVSRQIRDSQEASASQYESRLQAVTESRFNDVMERIQQETAEAGSRVAAELKAASETSIRELSEKVNASAAVLREEAAQATSRIESSVEGTLETFSQQLDRITHAGLEQQQKDLAGNIAELQRRLMHAAEMLMPGGSKDE